MRQKIFIFSLLLCGLLNQVSAQDSGSMEYRQVVTLMHLDQAVQVGGLSLRKLQFKLRMTPRDSSITPGDLVITFLESKPPITFHANRFGAFDIPLSKKLFDANPTMVVNKGFTKGLSIGVDLRILNENPRVISIEEISAAEREYKEALSHVGLITRLLAPTLDKLVLRVSTKEVRCELEGKDVQQALPAPNENQELRMNLLSLLKGKFLRINCNGPVDEYLLESSK